MTRERGVPRYNQFRRLIHKEPISSFDELTENPVWRQQIKKVYNNDLEKVDLMTGLFAEPLPEGFGFSETAFRIFVLMASRRLKSDRFFTDDYKRGSVHGVRLDVSSREYDAVGAPAPLPRAGAVAAGREERLQAMASGLGEPDRPPDMIIGSVAVFKLFVAIVFYLFLPLTALTYYFSRRQRRVIEVDRMLAILNVEPTYAKAYLPDTLSSYVWPSATRPSPWIGLALLFFSREIGLADGRVSDRGTIVRRRLPAEGIAHRLRDGVPRGVPVGAPAHLSPVCGQRFHADAVLRLQHAGHLRGRRRRWSSTTRFRRSSGGDGTRKAGSRRTSGRRSRF